MGKANWWLVVEAPLSGMSIHLVYAAVGLAGLNL